MILPFAIIGGLVALIPGGSFLLIPLELFMLYQVANKHEAFELGSFLAIGATLVTLSGFLKGLAAFLHAVPLIGQIANSLVACGFIFIIGVLAEQHYSNQNKRS